MKKRLFSILMVCCLMLAQVSVPVSASVKAVITDEAQKQISGNETFTLDFHSRADSDGTTVKNAVTTWKITQNVPMRKSNTFTDVPADHWAYDYVEEAAADGAVNGIGSGLFAPGNPLTMAHFIVILTRAFYAGELAWRMDDPGWKNPSDSHSEAWYAASEKVGLDHALFQYVADGTDRIEEPLSRYDMASMLFMVLADNGIQAGDESSVDALISILDLDEFPFNALITVPDVYALGILKGYEDGAFHGDATMNRAQAAAVYCRLKRVLRELDPVQPPVPTPTSIPSPTADPIVIPTATPTVTPTATPTATPTVTPTATPTPVPEPEENTFQDEVFRLVNATREEYGLPPMELGTELCQAAQIRAEELTEEFSHTRPDGSSCFTVLRETGISYMAAGENIAAGQRTPEAVMESWMNSPGHRANILSESFQTLGVGCAYASDIYGIYWCQLFTD